MEECKELHQLNEQASNKYNELLEELECERFDMSLKAGETEFWLHQYKQLQEKYSELEELLECNQPSTLLQTANDEQRTTSITDTSDRVNHPSSLETNMGTTTREEPTRLQHTKCDLQPCLSMDAVAQIAATHDENILRDREFRTSQNYRNETEERPRLMSNDCRCMAALVKVNGFEAYALLDSGSMMVSITQDFARVAKLNIKELENPVPLQLGMVGSHSMINFGAKA